MSLNLTAVNASIDSISKMYPNVANNLKTVFYAQERDVQELVQNEIIELGSQLEQLGAEFVKEDIDAWMEGCAQHIMSQCKIKEKIMEKDMTEKEPAVEIVEDIKVVEPPTKADEQRKVLERLFAEKKVTVKEYNFIIKKINKKKEQDLIDTVLRQIDGGQSAQEAIKLFPKKIIVQNEKPISKTVILKNGWRNLEKTEFDKLVADYKELGKRDKDEDAGEDDKKKSEPHYWICQKFHAKIGAKGIYPADIAMLKFNEQDDTYWQKVEDGIFASVVKVQIGKDLHTITLENLQKRLQAYGAFDLECPTLLYATMSAPFEVQKGKIIRKVTHVTIVNEDLQKWQAYQVKRAQAEEEKRMTTEKIANEKREHEQRMLSLTVEEVSTAKAKFIAAKETQNKCQQDLDTIVSSLSADEFESVKPTLQIQIDNIAKEFTKSEIAYNALIELVKERVQYYVKTISGINVGITDRIQKDEQKLAELSPKRAALEKVIGVFEGRCCTFSDAYEAILTECTNVENDLSHAQMDLDDAQREIARHQKNLDAFNTLLV
jgi:hypothetical protein